MQVVCAWCKKVMGEKESSGDTLSITHSICPECKKNVLAGIPSTRDNGDGTASFVGKLVGMGF